MNNIFAERLKKAMEQKNMKQIDLVKKAAEQGVKLGKSHVSQYLSGKTTPRSEILNFLATTLGVETEWLKGTDVSVDTLKKDTNEMNIQIFGTKKCNDTKKAERFFKERGIKFQFIDMKEKGMSKGEFNSVAQVNGGLENMINWEGKDKDLLALIKYIADEDKLEKVLENPQVIKTPVVRNGKQSTLGYQPDVWKAWK